MISGRRDPIRNTSLCISRNAEGSAQSLWSLGWFAREVLLRTSPALSVKSPGNNCSTFIFILRKILSAEVVKNNSPVTLWLHSLLRRCSPGKVQSLKGGWLRMHRDGPRLPLESIHANPAASLNGVLIGWLKTLGIDGSYGLKPPVPACCEFLRVKQRLGRRDCEKRILPGFVETPCLCFPLYGLSSLGQRCSFSAETIAGCLGLPLA